MVTKLLNG